MKITTLAGLAIALALLLPTVALAQEQNRTFKDANGREVGRSVTDSPRPHHVLRCWVGTRAARPPATARRSPTTRWVARPAPSRRADDMDNQPLPEARTDGRTGPRIEGRRIVKIILKWPNASRRLPQDNTGEAGVQETTAAQTFLRTIFKVRRFAAIVDHAGQSWLARS